MQTKSNEKARAYNYRNYELHAKLFEGTNWLTGLASKLVFSFLSGFGNVDVWLRDKGFNWCSWPSICASFSGKLKFEEIKTIVALLKTLEQIETQRKYRPKTNIITNLFTIQHFSRLNISTFRLKHWKKWMKNHK